MRPGLSVCPQCVSMRVFMREWRCKKKIVDGCRGNSDRLDARVCSGLPMELIHEYTFEFLILLDARARLRKKGTFKHYDAIDFAYFSRRPEGKSLSA